MKAIDTAIKRLTPSTQAELARRLGLHPQEVNRWVRRGWAAPKYAPAIEHMTGVTCIELVSDLPSNKRDS
jgi:DNA-binding transcriptional regulator YdaS (Cro superfamily)